ncbi:MAG: prolipoprotein diacylglyceryl transferase [Bdellovibrionaceae bacterium]|nr:prolipoprotein diacylglyceryl transferase [Bdellovibrio sp.]
MIPEIVLGAIRIPTFFLVISLSLSILLVFLSKRVDQFGKSRTHAFNLALILMAAGFIGGRLMHVFYEDWAYYRADLVQILFFWNGGFVFYGGMLACLAAAWLYVKFQKLNFFEWADFFTPLLSLSHALGRVGCLLAGCCYGSMCLLPWALDNRHPTALYLIGGELIIFAYVRWCERAVIKGSAKIPPRGQLFIKWVFLHSLLRFEVEYFRDDFRGHFFTLPAFGSISISQMICLIFMMLAIVYFIVSSEWLKKLYIRPPS